MSAFEARGRTLRDRMGEAVRRDRYGLIRPLWADMAEEEREAYRERVDHLVTLMEELGIGAVDDVWWEFLDREAGLCGLCGNTGMIHTSARSAAGKEAHAEGPCICPNGRSIKEHGRVVGKVAVISKAKQGDPP